MKNILVYYIFSDCVEEYYPEITKLECDKLVDEQKAECYTLADFENAFNDEMISDLGYIKIFWNCQ